MAEPIAGAVVEPDADNGFRTDAETVVAPVATSVVEPAAETCVEPVVEPDICTVAKLLFEQSRIGRRHIQTKCYRSSCTTKCCWSTHATPKHKNLL